MPGTGSGVVVKGDRELQALISRLGKFLTREQAEKILLDAASPVAVAAAGRVPTGPPALHLKEHVVAVPVSESAAGQTIAEGAVARVGIGPAREVFYGRFLEFGSVKQAAEPWLRPAFDAMKDQTLKLIMVQVLQRLKAAVGRG